jgi:hypothetical protein
VSGDVISIVAAENSDLARFVDAISRLPEQLPDWVLIGGVAVVLRFGGAHRATVDIDTLARESDRLVELLVGEGGERHASHKFVVPVATELDVMAVGSIPDQATVEPSEYAFALAREWAFSTGRLQAVTIVNEQGRVVASASMRVATTAGLIALKAVSLPRRADSKNPAKAVSDTIDLLALIESNALDELALSLLSAPNGLRDWVTSTCQRVFVADRRYTEARLQARRATVSPGALNLAAQLAERLLAGGSSD